jgi:lysophospholipase L1-like esterase
MFRGTLYTASLALVSAALLGCITAPVDPEEDALAAHAAPEEGDELVAEAESALLGECHIQPFGDSLTAGYPPPLWPANGGYRDDLVVFPPSVGPIRMVGSEASYSPAWMAAQAFHSGYPMKRADELDDLVPFNVWGANVILVHAGTNDILQGQGHIDAANDLNWLVRTLLVYNPTAKILVAKIIPLAGPLDAAVFAFNILVDSIVAQLNLEGHYRVHMVDLNTGFPMVSVVNGVPVPTLADGVHPIDSGYAWMADRWRAKINAVGCF